jgi:divalent metal cation (Fe/Co/Zn/Cd) transporter
VVPGDISVVHSHDLTDHLEADLNTEYPRAMVTIHVEPCSDGKCNRCGSFCTFNEKHPGQEKPD